LVTQLMLFFLYRDWFIVCAYIWLIFLSGINFTLRCFCSFPLSLYSLLNPLIVTSQKNGTTYYHSQSLEESFSFSPLTATIYWPIQINASSLLGLSLSYVIDLPNDSPLPSTPFFPNRTSKNSTTFFIPLGGDLYALLVVPYVFASFQVSCSGTRILLQFPPFNSSL
jgi:hypothetical protein